MSSTMSCLWDRAKNCRDLCFVLLDNVIFVRTVVPITLEELTLLFYIIYTSLTSHYKY